MKSDVVISNHKMNACFNRRMKYVKSISHVFLPLLGRGPLSFVQQVAEKERNIRAMKNQGSLEGSSHLPFPAALRYECTSEMVYATQGTKLCFKVNVLWIVDTADFGSQLWALPDKWYNWLSTRHKSYKGRGSIPGRVKRYLSSLVLGVDGWMQGKRFTRGAAIDSPPVPHSLWNQPHHPWRKQAEMGVADHSLPV